MPTSSTSRSAPRSVVRASSSWSCSRTRSSRRRSSSSARRRRGTRARPGEPDAAAEPRISSWSVCPHAVFVGALAALLFRGLLRPEVRGYLHTSPDPRPADAGRMTVPLRSARFIPWARVARRAPTRANERTEPSKSPQRGASDPKSKDSGRRLPGSRRRERDSSRSPAHRAGRPPRPRPPTTSRGVPGAEPEPPDRDRAAAAILAVVGGVSSSVDPGLVGCSNILDPAPDASPAAGASARLGYPAGRHGHQPRGQRPQRYTFCPPASGNHYNAGGHRADHAARLRPQGQRWPAELGPQPGARRPRYPLPRRQRRRRARPARRFRTSSTPSRRSPICQVPAGQLAPVIARFDADEVALCRPRLGQGAANAGMGSCARSPVLRNRVGANGRGR